jgi:hypothetical protein
MRYACRILVRRRDGKRPLGRPRRACEDNINAYLKGVRSEGLIWIRVTVTSGGMLRVQ